jgi:hypothetical protein
MNELGLKITRHYINFCGIDSISIMVCGLIKDLKVHLANYPEAAIIIDFVTIHVSDAWGMLLSRNWDTNLGGSLQMDLSYPTIPIRYGPYATFYNQPMMKNHVEYPNNKDTWSDHEIDVPSKIHERGHCDRFCEESMDPHLDHDLSQDFVILPFVQEDNFDGVDDIVFPKGRTMVNNS